MASWVEHDPYDLIDSVKTCIEHTIRKFEELGYNVSDIKGIGITNQRETAVVWDRISGKPLCPAIVWSDGRTAETVKKLASKSDKGIEAIKSICGLPLTTYFSGIKLRWMMDHNDNVKNAHDEGRLLFGTVDSWLIYVGLLSTAVIFGDGFTLNFHSFLFDLEFDRRQRRWFACY